MASSPPPIGFIGLGNMGWFMARNLLQSGHAVAAYDVNADAVARLAHEGATVATSPRHVAESCKTVITMLPSFPHVRNVYLEHEESILSAGPDALAGSLFIDSSTIDPGTAAHVADIMSQANPSAPPAVIDAPVSGGVPGADAGTLTFMVGGPAAHFDRAQPVLAAMGKNIVHCGENAGSGQVAKLCNNLVLGISMVGVAEGLNLGVRFGLDAKVLSNIFNTSSARCWSSDTYNPCPGVMEGVPAARDYEGGFGTDLIIKDLGLAQKAAKEVGAFSELTRAAKNVYQRASDEGHGSRDFGVVFREMKERW